MKRFDVKVDDPYLNLYADATDALATRAGVKTAPITVDTMSHLDYPELVTKMLGGGYDNSGKQIIINDVIRKPAHGETFMHEYGHAIDSAKWLGLKGRILPYIYPFTHYSSEVAANNEALKLLDQIEDPADRAAAKELYNKGQQENLQTTKLLKPIDYGRGIGGIIGGIGGGYIGYKGGKWLTGKLYDAVYRSLYRKPLQTAREKARYNKYRTITGRIGGLGTGYLGAKGGYILGNLGGILGGVGYMLPQAKQIREQAAKIPEMTAEENEQFANILRRTLNK